MMFGATETASGLTFDVDLPPGERVYCLIGENGAGKTSFLESLAAVAMFAHVVWRPAAKSDPHPLANLRTKKGVGEAITDHMLSVPTGTLDGVAIKSKATWGFAKVNELGVVGRTSLSLISKPLAFIPASRRASLNSISATALSLVTDRASVFGSVLRNTLDALAREPVDSLTVTTWLTSRLLLNPNFIAGFHSPLHEVRALFALLQTFDESHFGGIISADEQGNTRLSVLFADGELYFMGRPINRLASGYSALIKIFQGIISTIAAWESMRGSDDILGSDALIFIDEIDAHLHPRWQRRLLPFLKESFPNATFIVTTHSALVVRDTAPGEAHELVRDGKHVTSRALGSPRDWYLSDVYSDAFHVDLAPTGSEGDADDPPVLELLLDFSRAVRDYTASKAESDREAALALHAAIVPRLPADDPRLQSVAQLRGLLG